MVALLLSAIGCGPNVAWSPMNASPKPMQPRPIASVEVFNSTKPERPFVEVGILRSDRTSAWDTEIEMLNLLRAEAAAHGCDGLLITNRDVGAFAMAGGGYAKGGTATNGVDAACIVFR